MQLAAAANGPRANLIAVESIAEWTFAPEGAAVCGAETTAVIADVHLGYEWRRGERGDVVPVHSLHETIARLAALLDRAPITRLIVAGDLTESARPCERTDRAVAALRGWLAERAVELVSIRGNHDRDRDRESLPESVEVAGWTIAHGDRPIAAKRSITGHLHPVLKGFGISVPCILAGERGIVLPAFSANAAGLGVIRGKRPARGLDGRMRCLAGVDGALLDFGPLGDLARMLAKKGDGANYPR